MSLQVEKLENNMAKLTIEVPANDLEKALQSAYMKQKNKIAMPGFRKGKVPRQMIEKMYGPEIFYDDAANALIPKAYSEAYDECDLEIVSRPEINIVQIEKGKSFIFPPSNASLSTNPSKSRITSSPSATGRSVTTTSLAFFSASSWILASTSFCVTRVDTLSTSSPLYSPSFTSGFVATSAVKMK